MEGFLFSKMREMGLEPTRAYTHKILSLACLPIPALPQHEWSYSIDFSTWQPFLTNFFNFFQKSNSIKNLKNNIDKSLLLIYNNFRCLNKAAEQNKMQKWRNWQTRTVQVRVVVIPCGFDSHLLQAENRNFQYGDSCFYVHFFCSRPARHQTVRHRRHIRSFSGPAAGRLFPILFRNIRTCGSAHNQCGVKYHPFRLFLWVFQLF